MKFNDYDKPIKIIHQDGIKIESDGDYDITISRKVTLSELAAIFGVDEIDMLYDGIGIWTLKEEKEDVI